MQYAPAALLHRIASWPGPAQQALWGCRALFLDVARAKGLGPLDEALKWGQPAWRPRRPRTGTTLRIGWTGAEPAQLSLLVDCKTDIAARMRALHPELPRNDGRREIALALADPLPEQALATLSAMTFAYHLQKHARGSMG